jgi:hypothetical protein
MHISIEQTRSPSESRKRERERVAALSAHAKLIIEYTQACNTLLKEELFMHNNTHTHSESSARRTQTQPLYLYMHTRRENNKYRRVESEPARKTQCAFFALSAGAKSSDRTTDVNSCMCGLLFSYSLFRRARVCVYASAEREKTGRGQSVSTSTTAHFLYEHGGQHFGGISMIFSLFTSLERATAHTYIRRVCARVRETWFIHLIH